jgi:hydroxymethylpyrimidine pyrophosphatase-like HAD family hydrolase/energy-coupling factor transporter ATP-binding protein EcfA2
VRYLALACDYDGTLAHDGIVDDATVAALERVRESGRRLVLVTGRELDDLQTVFDRLDLFDRAVLENGALLYRPATRETLPLGEPPPPAFVESLRARGVTPLSVGRVIVATWRPHETTVTGVIAELGLELQIIFNKGAVMVLPSGVNKASGLSAALDELALSAHNVVAVGDAENDHAFVGAAECAVAVANALPVLKERCDVVTRGERGAGVVEVADALVDSDLRDLVPALPRHAIELGARGDGEHATVPAYGASLLVIGPSGSGKSTVATGLLERAAQAGYQFCVVDPEGDYDEFPDSVTLGDAQHTPTPEEVLAVLEDPRRHVVVNMVGVRFEDRPGYFAQLLPGLHKLRARTGRPHWVLVDEAHHVLPARRREVPPLEQESNGLVLVTVHPDRLPPDVLRGTTTLVAVGDAPGETIAAYADVLGEPAPRLPDTDGCRAIVWPRRPPDDPFALQPTPGTVELKRHRRKYAQGELLPEENFVFTGPDGRLALRAQNLLIFLQIAEGVDDQTWVHHLRRGDYSAWFRRCIKDDALAEEARAVEDAVSDPEQSRAQIRAAIEQRYTLPA